MDDETATERRQIALEHAELVMTYVIGDDPQTIAEAILDSAGITDVEARSLEPHTLTSGVCAKCWSRASEAADASSTDATDAYLREVVRHSHVDGDDSTEGEKRMNDTEADGSEIKIGYTTAEGHESKAYVRKYPPHTGFNKYTDEPVEVVWDEARQRYVERGAQ